MTSEELVIRWLKDEGQLAAHAREEARGDEFEFGDYAMHELLLGVYESADDAAKVHGALGHTITCINAAPNTQTYLKQINPEATLDLISADTPAALRTIMSERAQSGRRFG